MSELLIGGANPQFARTNGNPVKSKAVFLLAREHANDVYNAEVRARLEALASTPIKVRDPESLRHNPEALKGVEVIFSGWGMPRCDETFLNAAPNLKLILYAAGSVRSFVTDELWRREIAVSSSNNVLAASVAEFTLGQILLSLKSVWRQVVDTRAARQPQRCSFPGINGSIVGLVSLGSIARHLVSLLRPFKIRIVVYDPFFPKAAAQNLGVELVSLEQLFEISHAVSLHTPWLPETEGMIRGHHFERMRHGATFINTARGAIVNEPEMIEALIARPDLYALLDVTHPEPAPPESLLYDLPNVVLTPHIAGALGRECRRMGTMAADEFERYLKGEPLHGEVRKEMMRTIA